MAESSSVAIILCGRRSTKNLHNYEVPKILIILLGCGLKVPSHFYRATNEFKSDYPLLLNKFMSYFNICYGKNV